MKMKVNIKLLAVAGLLMTGTLVTWGMRTHLFDKKKNVLNAKRGTTFPPIVYDSVLIRKLKAVSHAFNDQNRSFSYSGVINIADGADTAATVKNLRFMFYRNDQDTYSKTGNTETLNANGVYLYIEHDHKRMVVSAQKKIDDPPVADMNKMVNNLQSEHYELQDKKEGPYETIAIVNEHHITCKEYAITFDTSSHRVSHIYMRLTNFHFPLNRQKERVIDVSVNSSTAAGSINQYIDRDKIIVKTEKGWKPAAQYAGYELINLP